MGGSPCDFFKVYLSQQSSKQLGLPPAFVSKLGGKIPKNCAIKDPNGKVWPVKLEGAKAGFVVAKGWQEFASHHSLVDGDFLIFDYDGHSQFGVEIYGINGLRKRKAPDAWGSTSRQAEAPSSGLPRGPLSLVIRPNGYCHGHASGKLTQCPSHVVHPKVEKATINFTSSYPYFKKVMHPCQLKTTLSVPCRFVMDHIKLRMEHSEQRSEKLSETILLSGNGDGKWGVTLIIYFKHKYQGKLSAGWLKFVRDNRVEVGDECFFELVSNNPVILKVSIFKHNR